MYLCNLKVSNSGKTKMFAGHIFSYKMKMFLVRLKKKKDIFLIECSWEDSVASFKPPNGQYLFCEDICEAATQRQLFNLP